MQLAVIVSVKPVAVMLPADTKKSNEVALWTIVNAAAALAEGSRVHRAVTANGQEAWTYRGPSQAPNCTRSCGTARVLRQITHVCTNITATTNLTIPQLSETPTPAVPE